METSVTIQTITELQNKIHPEQTIDTNIQSYVSLADMCLTIAIQKNDPAFFETSLDYMSRAINLAPENSMLYGFRAKINLESRMALLKACKTDSEKLDFVKK